VKRPQVKSPELKVPPVLLDVFNDLRDRRLLPLLALVIVAIVAVPFLLGGTEEETSPPSPVTPSPGPSAENASLTVVEATPGLRDYRKRLRARVATDPFKQRYTAPALKGSELPSASSTSSTTTTSTGTTTTDLPADGGSAPPAADAPSDSPPGGSGGGNGANHGGDPAGGRFFTWTIDVKIAHTETKADGSVAMGEPTTHEGVRSLTPLPGVKAPVVTFIGVSPDSGKAILMVSKDVTAVFGDTKCVSGTESCELLEVEAGFPVTFTYGPGEVRYKLNVLKIELVRSGHS
jgi:hypothetical protein